MKLSDEQIQDLLRVGNPTDEECRLIRMGWDAAIAEIRAQPVGWVDAGDLRALEYGNSVWLNPDDEGQMVPVYLAAPSVPEDVLRDAKRYRFLRAAKNIPISTEAARDPIVYDAAIDAAMLAAATETKK